MIRFYGEGPIVITRAGSLKIGRITMQRKGGDNGRESANMLQFKINPVDLFELMPKTSSRTTELNLRGRNWGDFGRRQSLSRSLAAI